MGDNLSTIQGGSTRRKNGKTGAHSCCSGGCEIIGLAVVRKDPVFNVRLAAGATDRFMDEKTMQRSDVLLARCNMCQNSEKKLQTPFKGKLLSNRTPIITMLCNTCWNNPTTKDAYRLTITTVVIEILATLWGIRTYKVR
jgi:uncharacterized protein YlaI